MMMPVVLYELETFPESPQEGQEAILLRSELLCQLTLEILDYSVHPSPPVLGQLILKREILLETLRQLMDHRGEIFRHLSPETLVLVNKRFKQCQGLDEHIHQNLEHVCLNLKKGLSGIRSSRNVLNQYRLSQDVIHSRSIQG